MQLVVVAARNNADRCVINDVDETVCGGHKRVSSSSVSQHKVADRSRRFPHADFYVVTQPVQAIH